jgi:integrating conjugative element protein (TIGR03749 family)
MRLIRQGLKCPVLLCLAAGSVLSGAAHAETVVWRKIPIAVELVVGVEQLLILPANAEVGLPPALTNPNVFRTLVTGGAAYWTALEPFETQRVQLRLDTGEFLLFDVSARTLKQPPADVETLQVVLAGSGTFQGGPGLNTGGPLAGEANLFELLRYAAQSIYAPQRLIAPLPGVKKVPVGLAGNLGRLYDAGRHPLVIQPYQAWVAGDFFVTAFVVTNEASHPVVLDNRRLMHTPHAHRTGVDPHFIASAFYTRTLPGRNTGSRGDNRTTLFVVTDRPIRTVIRRAGQ